MTRSRTALTIGLTLTLLGCHQDAHPGDDAGPPQPDAGSPPQLDAGDVPPVLQPEINVTPALVDFGNVPAGGEALVVLTVSNLGDAPLMLGQMLLNGSQDFTPLIDGRDPRRQPEVLDDPDGDGEPGLAPGAMVEVTVRYAPSVAGPDRGTLGIFSDDPARPEVIIELLGEGVPNACPRAVSVQEEYTVRPLDVVTLDGSPSIDPDGPDGQPAEWEWVIVNSPNGSTTQPYERFFNNQQPANGGQQDDRSTPTAQLFVDLQGTFELELRVRDALGLSSAECETSARVVIHAEYEEAIRAELTWRTPGDPDLFDDTGADLDLHMLHPNGDGWFSWPFDCFVDNPTPDWGQLENPADDPIIDVSAVAGRPENITLYLPENTEVLGRPYVVGVHALSQVDPETGADFGPSVATLRIFIRGELAWDFTEDGEPGNREMRAQGHFWDAAAIEWPSGQVTTRDHYSTRRP